MRLRDYEVKAIRSAFSKYFSPKDRLYLFGSRVDDTARGGDIDLYLQTEEMDVQQLWDKKIKFLIDVEREIGEQKIDFVVHRIHASTDLSIYKVAQEQGILLS